MSMAGCRWPAVGWSWSAKPPAAWVTSVCSRGGLLLGGLRVCSSSICWLHGQGDGEGGAFAHFRVTLMVPWCCSTMFFTIFRPMPVPGLLSCAWKKGSKMRWRSSSRMPTPSSLTVMRKCSGIGTQRSSSLGVLIGIGEEVADNLGDGLAVDDGGEVLVGVGHGEVLATILEGGCEALADGLDQLVDVLRSKVHHQALLLHLAEVEQLVDQFEQAVGIAVDDAQLVALDLDFLKGSDDERHGCAYLVGNHGEEVQACLTHLLLLLLVQPLHLLLVAVLGPLQSEVDIIPDGADEQQIEASWPTSSTRKAGG